MTDVMRAMRISGPRHLNALTHGPHPNLTLHKPVISLNPGGVLFIDADGNGVLSNSHEYVFTEWAGGSTDDLDALRRVFDSNVDGKLTSADAHLDKNRVLATGAGEKTIRSCLAAFPFHPDRSAIDASQLAISETCQRLTQNDEPHHS